MKKEQTQEDKVLLYMQKHGSITSLDAFENFGTTRLSAKIYNLRKTIKIKAERITVKNRFGDNCNVAKYSIEK